MERYITTDELKKAYLYSAKVVSIYGDVYLPIFERLEAEYNNRLKTENALHRAISALEENV